MSTIEKIINLIKTDKEIAENLFLFKEFPENVKLWTGEDEDNFDFTSIKWLFVTDHSNLTLVGVNTIDKNIWCIDDEGDFHQDSDALENLPYEIMRIDCKFTKDKTIEAYFDKYKEEGYKETLQRYEQWCKDNNIELDKDHIYHDENENMFSKYFKINN